MRIDTALLPVILCMGLCVVCLSEGSNRPQLAVFTVSNDPPLDGLLAQPEWSGIPAIQKLTMVEPKQGGVPSAQTIVKVLANSKEIVFGIWCKDPNPKGIVSFSKERDADLAKQDHIKI